MTDGYAGNILRIDLTETRIKKQPLPADMADAFIGGRGFVAKTLFDELPPNTDPLGPDNLFVAASGPLSGQFMPASGKTHFGCKSPATGGYGDSNLGGHFGPALKYAGYDMMVLTGRAAVPSIVVIEDEKVLLSVNKELFERLGYSVLEAATGEEAIHIARTFNGEIDVALLDVVLPDINGPSVYPRLMEARPNLKVIVCSGFSVDGPAQEILDAGAQEFITKPIDFGEISEKLKQLLESDG